MMKTIKSRNEPYKSSRNESIGNTINNSDICVICQQDLNDETRKTVQVECCKKKFHYVCLCKWLMNYKNNKCPLCKEIIEDDLCEDYNFYYNNMISRYGPLINLENLKKYIIKEIKKIKEKYGTDAYLLDKNIENLKKKYKNTLEIIQDTEKYLDLNRSKDELDYIV